jgi:hypothetical protein
MTDKNPRLDTTQFHSTHEYVGNHVIGFERCARCNLPHEHEVHADTAKPSPQAEEINLDT